MRTLEVMVWAACAAWMMWRVVGKPAGRANMLAAGIVVAIVVAQIAIEGARFHLGPLYLTAAALVALAAIPRTRAAAFASCRWRLASGATAALVLAVAAGLPSLFPVFAYDEPGGTFGIGTADYELNDSVRHRDLAVQLWYPAARGAHGTPSGITARPALLASAYAAVTGLPAAMFDNLRLVRTHAIRGVPMADGARFPIVVFSHGPGSANRSQSVFQMEALASRGFVVAAIDHTGYASTTIFPDGRTVPVSPDFAWPVFVDARSTAMVQTWRSDVSFVIDELARLDASDPAGVATGRLDLSRIGYLGASFGGSVVVQALLDEPRIAAGVAQDGKPYFAEKTPTDLRRPLMYMQSAMPYIKSTPEQLAKWGITPPGFKTAEQDHYTRQMRLFASAGGPVYNVFIRGTDHISFSDLYLIVRVPDRSRIDVRRAHRIINDYTVAFFDRYLNGTRTPLVDGWSPAPDDNVTVAARNVPGAGMLNAAR
jgi:predicted dienelactone hydrolase